MFHAQTIQEHSNLWRLGYSATMESIEAESLKKLLFEDKIKANILYVKVDDKDDVLSALEQSNKLTKNILLLLSSSNFLTLNAVKDGAVPEAEQEEALYVLCNHGYLSELAGLYLEVAGFEKVFNVKGGMEALLKLEP